MGLKLMSDKSDTADLPHVTLRQFLLGLANHTAPEDEVLSANTLRLMIRDFRDHARRFRAEINT